MRREQSIGSDETFDYDVDDPAYIHRQLLKLSDRTAARMRAAGLMGRTVSIKVRFSDFTTITRSKTLREPTDISRDIYEAARVLFDALGLQRARIRLVGVRVEQLVELRRSTHPGDPRRARPRVARRRPGSRPGQCEIRGGKRAASQPDRGTWQRVSATPRGDIS